MREKLCLFAGTTEGRQLAELLSGAADLTVCVATEYGEVLLDGIPDIAIRTGRMTADEMEPFFNSGRFTRILDATHPYAALVTENIREAAGKAGIPVMRILRDCDGTVAGAEYVPSVEAARDFLMAREGRIFLTTGAKELSAYVGLDMERVWARVLPTQSSLDACAAAGIPSAHIIAAQGPFSEEINLAEMKQIGARYMVTKASGKAGGFGEKIRAAKAAGVLPVIVGLPEQTEGVSLDEAVAELGKTLSLPGRKVSVIGIGPGGPGCLTVEAKDALFACDAVIGARSVAESAAVGKPLFFEFLPEKIRAVLDAHPAIRRAAVVMRGDTGFFSGAKKLLGALGGYEVTLFAGVSSVSLFAARLGVSWDDAALISLHGRDSDLIHAVAAFRKVFALTGGENTPAVLCQRLCLFGLGHLQAAVGEKLSYPDERIIRGTAEELSAGEYDALSVLYIENDAPDFRVRHGIPDDEFIRGEVPMTKAEVRAVSMAALDLPPDAQVYDIGAGTGSVSVECALSAYAGHVWAVEKEADAAELVRQNRVKFRAENLSVIEGIAPAALEDLPAPTHAFIGGSSGNLRDIITALLRKNPDVRIVLNAITLETQAEAAACAGEFGFSVCETVTVNAARARKLGRYHMMTAQNPVSVITLAGGKVQ